MLRVFLGTQILCQSMRNLLKDAYLNKSDFPLIDSLSKEVVSDISVLRPTCTDGARRQLYRTLTVFRPFDPCFSGKPGRRNSRTVMYHLVRTVGEHKLLCFY